MSFEELASRTGPAVLQAPGQMKSVPSHVAATLGYKLVSLSRSPGACEPPATGSMFRYIHMCIFQQARFSAFIIFKGIHKS